MPRTAACRAANSSKASGRSRQTVSRPLRRVTTSPAARSRPTCHDTSGCDSPTWATSSATVASASARRRTIRSRLTSARALWTRRSSRRSFGWATADASVERIRAGDGDRVGILAERSHQRPFISMEVDAIPQASRLSTPAKAVQSRRIAASFARARSSTSATNRSVSSWSLAVSRRASSAPIARCFSRPRIAASASWRTARTSTRA